MPIVYEMVCIEKIGESKAKKVKKKNSLHTSNTVNARALRIFREFKKNRSLGKLMWGSPL